MRSLYLVAILPPPETTNRIDQLRRECAENYQVFKALRPPVHITLYKPVWIEETLEPQLIQSLVKVAAGHHSFQQETRDYSRFGKRVLYLSALVNPEILALQKDITKAFLENGFDNDARTDQAYHPHFTLAFRDVTPEKFDAMWNEYQNRKFYDQFSVDSFSILKHDGSKWNVLANIPLSGSPDQ